MRRGVKLSPVEAVAHDLARQFIFVENHNQRLDQFLACEFNDVIKAAKRQRLSAEDMAEVQEALKISGV